MKKSFVFVAAALASVISPLAAFAQDAAPAAAPAGGGHGPRMSPEERLKAMKEKLGLSDDQVAKIKAIFDENMPKLKALHEDTATSQEDKRSKGKEIMDAQRTAIQAVLTPDQQAKWKAEMEQHRPGGAAPAAK